MPACKDKNNNTSEDEVDNTSTADKMYHESESFLRRYRWWIVLVLAILLGLYLYNRRQEGEESGSFAPASSGNAPRLGDNTLNIGEPAPALDTDGRRLFRL